MELGEQAPEISSFLFKERPDMDARWRARAPQRDDVCDLSQGKPETTRPSNEGEHLERVGWVQQPVTRRGPGCGRQNPACLVEPKGLATYPALG
jgi:hypothetical protein